MPPAGDRRQALALFRYSLIREAADPALGARERGALVRALAERDHLGPSGERVRVSRNTLDRWIAAWRVGGFDALLPDPRVGRPRVDADVLGLAVTLKREQPRRSAAQIAAVIAERHGHSPHERTLQRHFRRVGLDRELAAARGALRSFGRFEAEAPNQLWTADALHGPAVAGRKAYLFAAIDDHSRALVGYRWALAEDTLRLEAALRAAFAARGLPGALYVDNGSPFVSRQLERCLAVLGIRLVHSRPGQPQGRGKVERAFRTVREQFLVELDARGGAADLDELNRLFGAWVEGVYHHREHSETGQAPMERFLAGAPPRLPTPAELREAFLWAECRQVTKQAMVSLFGNRYQVDPALVGATVELVFDPFDLGRIEVRYRKRPMGQAVPFQLDRHVHPAAKPDPAVQATPHPSGIDYLAMVEQRTAATQRRRIAYASLPELPNAGTDPGAGAHDHAATPNPNPHDATKIGPLGVGLHLPTTITPDEAAHPAVGGPTTKPITDIGHADQPMNIDTVRTEDAS
ncbi:MAG TPA: DDE-type integrase/transposase/recombinase [Actinomycetes bacterium]|jgi:putative transposase